MLLRLLLLLGAALLAPSAAAQPSSALAQIAEHPGVAAPVRDALARGEAHVLVFLPDAGPAASAAAARVEALLAGLPPGLVEPTRRYGAVPAFGARLAAPGLLRLLERNAALRVALDAPIRIQNDEATALTRTDYLRDAKGLDGSGVEVAIVDTGIDLSHPDLAGSVVAEQCFCQGTAACGGSGAPCCPNDLDTQSGPGAAADDNAHGTRVSGVVRSAGVVAPEGGASDASLTVVKVTDAMGGGCASDLVAALDWLLLSRPALGVVNMSLGGGLYEGDCDDANAITESYAAAIDLLYTAGVLVVAGSGNNGSGTGMNAPACVANAVSVGAVWDDTLGSETRFGCTDPAPVPDLVACWSNSSTTTDVFAPGGRITTTDLGGGANNLYGTSFSTPMVTACAADLLEGMPGVSPAQLTLALRESPISVTDATNGLSFPRLQCTAARVFLAPEVPMLAGGPAARAALALLIFALAVRARRG